MAIADITKPMALDETLQGTNTALGLLVKDTTVSAISTALALLGKDTSIQAVVTALGLLNKDATMVTQNSKLDTIIAKLQGIIEALGVDTSIYKAAGNKACAELTSSLLVAGNLGNVYNITDNGTTTADFVEGAGKPIHLGDNVAVVDIGEGGTHVYKFDLLSGLVDLSNYIQKSETAGLIKNDGTIDETPYTVVEASETNGNIVIDDVETPVYRNYGNNTVLATDKTSFLTRQTLNPTGFSGYVREKLVGVSYAWNQLLTNGDFSNGTNTWTARQGTVSASGGIATVTPSSEGTQRGITGVTNQMSIIAGHKYLLSAWIKPPINGNASCGLDTGSTTQSVTANTWNFVANIVNAESGVTRFYCLFAESVTTSQTIQYKNCQTIDLTLAFGSTIADYLYGLSNNGGITKLRDMGCPIDKYTPYGYGLYSVKTSGKKVVGKNLFDSNVYENKRWSTADGTLITANNFLASTSPMYVYGSTKNFINYPVYRTYYDSGMNFISADSTGNAVVSTPSNAYYMHISQSRADFTPLTCIVAISETEIAFEPYSCTTYSLGSTELRGHFILSNGEIVAEGDVRESNGEVTRNYGIVDLGSLEWVYNSSNHRFYCTLPSAKASNLIQSICAKYVNVSDLDVDKTYTMRKGYQVADVLSILISDSAYTDAATFKTAMSGVYLIYELATPTTEQSTPFADPMSLVGATTEEYIDTRDIPCPVGAERQYMGQSEDVVEIPSTPQSDGVWVQKCYVSGGKAQYVWELEITL